jgi:hypothetical protein
MMRNNLFWSVYSRLPKEQICYEMIVKMSARSLTPRHSKIFSIKFMTRDLFRSLLDKLSQIVNKKLAR